MMREKDPNNLGHLENITWMSFNPIPFLEDNNITAPIQKGVCVCYGLWTRMACLNY